MKATVVLAWVFAVGFGAAAYFWPSPLAVGGAFEVNYVYLGTAIGFAITGVLGVRAAFGLMRVLGVVYVFIGVFGLVVAMNQSGSHFWQVIHLNWICGLVHLFIGVALLGIGIAAARAFRRDFTIDRLERRRWTTGWKSTGAPPPMARPSIPRRAPVKARRTQEDSDDFDAIESEPETRRATVRYYRRMNPQRLYPFLVIFSKEMIQQITKPGADQRDSGPFQVDVEAPVDVEPVLPGCACYPPKITTKLNTDTDKLVFYVAPNVVGKIHGGKVVVTQNHAILAEVELKMKVVQRTWFYISAAMTVILPFISAVATRFGWDFATQMDTGFELYLQIIRFVFMLVSPYVLTAVLACVTLVLFWMTRPKRKDEFWDITMVKPKAKSGVQ